MTVGFRDLVADVDSVVYETLADVGYIEGRRVLGMMSVPWLQPQVGRLNTGIREPHFVIRVGDAAGVEKSHRVTIDLPAPDGGGEYVVVRLEPDGAGQVALVMRLTA